MLPAESRLRAAPATRVVRRSQHVKIVNRIDKFHIQLHPLLVTVHRDIARRVRDLCRSYPVVTITGPRQSGKTTLCRQLFPDKAYVSLEALDQRAFATNDPRGFLSAYSGGAVIDEVQRAPDLLSYLQVEVDERRKAGRFVLTGSANLALLESVSQSLAGRTGLVTLLPCSRPEYERFPGRPPGLWEQIWRGGFPAIPDRAIPPVDWFQTYVATYVERDVRQITNVLDLSAFQSFLGLMAGRTGQLLNLSQLGADAGVTHNTARAWLSVLEASYVAFRLPPFHANIRKRLVRAPKTYFYDTGLACFLLGIRTAEHLETHPLRGALFENYVVCEVLKAIFNAGRRLRLAFYRDHQGHEVDLLVERGNTTAAVEIKSAQTITDEFFADLSWLSDQEFGASVPRFTPFLVYGGRQRQRRTTATILPWSSVHEVDW